MTLLPSSLHAPCTHHSLKMAIAVVWRLKVERSLQYVQRASFNWIFSCAKDLERQLTIPDIWMRQNNCCNAYSSDAKGDNNSMENGPTPKAKKKKVFIPRVTLLSESKEMLIVTLNMAQKISTRRNLKLVKIRDCDMKTERPIYKLMTSKQYLQEGLATKKQLKQDSKILIKHEKLMSISTKISEHDLQTKLKSIVNLLTKRHEIRILISVEENNEKAEAMFTQIRTAVKDLSPSITRSSTSHNLKIHLRPQFETQMSDNLNNNATVDNNY